MAKKKRKLTTFEQLGLVAVLAVVGIYFYVRWVHDPMTKKLAKLEQECAALQQSVDRLNARPPNREVLKTRKLVDAEWREVEQELAQARKRLASSGEVSLVIDEVTRSARRSKLTIRALDKVPAPNLERSGQPESVLNGRSYHKVSLVGGFQNVTSFLAGLGKGSKIVSIENLSVSIANERGELKMLLLLRI